MPAYNFQARFAEAVTSGAKPHTIRATRKDGRRTKVGETLHLYTGMRTRGCRRLRPETPCVGVADIRIQAPHRIVALGEGSKRYRAGLLLPAEIEALATADGFPDVETFFAYFAAENDGQFEGQLIEWIEPEPDSFFTPEARDQARRSLNTLSVIGG